MIINSEQPVACVSACVSRHTRLSRETDSERERDLRMQHPNLSLSLGQDIQTGEGINQSVCVCVRERA